MHEYTLIHWNEDSQKWQDTNNNYFCSRLPTSEGWRVSARYGFPDGTRDKLFDNEVQAVAFFVNFLHSYHMNLTVEGYETLARKKARLTEAG